MLESHDQRLLGLRRCLQFAASPGYEVGVLRLDRIQFRHETFGLRNVDLEAVCIHFKILVWVEGCVGGDIPPPIGPVKEFGPFWIIPECFGCDVIVIQVRDLKKYNPGQHGSVLRKDNLKVKFGHRCVWVLLFEILFHLPNFDRCCRLYFFVVLSVVGSEPILVVFHFI